MPEGTDARLSISAEDCAIILGMADECALLTPILERAGLGTRIRAAQIARLAAKFEAVHAWLERAEKAAETQAAAPPPPAGASAIVTKPPAARLHRGKKPGGA